MFSLKRFRWYAREWVAAALFLTALGVAAGVFLARSSPRHYRLSITGGSVEGLRHQITVRLVEEAAAHGLTVRHVGTTGSWEALARVDTGQLDLALVQGGLDPSFHRH